MVFVLKLPVAAAAAVVVVVVYDDDDDDDDAPSLLLLLCYCYPTFVPQISSASNTVSQVR
jgi:hypothetical protein